MAGQQGLPAPGGNPKADIGGILPRADIVPFLVEDMLIANGGQYSKGPDWMPFAQIDGHLITGQNPASSELVAHEMLKMLQAK